jgi:hypothetical protein
MMAEGDAVPGHEIDGGEVDVLDEGGDGAASSPTGARELLRSALVDDEDPRFPWWLPLPGIALALGWGAWQAVSADGGGAGAFLGALVWPGPAILALATLATFFGWQLDID